MDLEFITKWIPVVHKIKICELSDCGIMVKIIRLLICTKYFSFKISYDTFDIIAPSKSLIKRTHHYSQVSIKRSNSLNTIRTVLSELARLIET